MPPEICLSTQVLFFLKKADIFGQHHRNLRGTNTYVLELDARAELLVDTTHEQSHILSNSRFRLALQTFLPTLKRSSHAALAGTPVLNLNSLDILSRDLKAFCGDSSGDLFEVEIFVVFSACRAHM